jgi:hypothetical protein
VDIITTVDQSCRLRVAFAAAVGTGHAACGETQFLVTLSGYI